VLDVRGNKIGTVDHMNGESEIKLTRTDSPDGVHHYIPLEWVESVDDSVRLSKTCDDIMRQRH
jgi:hypothetical protein